MTDLISVLTGSEKAVYTLRALYKKYGYKQYKMSKFEEYDLYVSNKDYLVSDNVITFTDTDGKLLALKPDVTLSIIKNGKDDVNDLKKVCYGENVYRVSKGTKSFKEIMQVGLECQGAVDDSTVSEVLTLAVLSLKNISSEYALDVSHLGIVSAVIENLGVKEKVKKQLLILLGDKNVQGIDTLCKEEGVEQEKADLLIKLATVYGEPSRVIAELKTLNLPNGAKEALIQLEKQTLELQRQNLIKGVNVDFSVVNNMSYYNGIVFKGFISGLPTGVLSGGQYDNLMQKMHKKSGAIGFAVYLDELENLTKETPTYDVDTLIVYGDNTPLSLINDEKEKAIKKGETVCASKTLPEKLRYKNVIRI